MLQFLIGRRGRDEEAFAIPAPMSDRMYTSPDPPEFEDGTYPAVNLPIILVPAIVA